MVLDLLGYTGVQISLSARSSATRLLGHVQQIRDVVMTPNKKQHVFLSMYNSRKRCITPEIAISIDNRIEVE